MGGFSAKEGSVGVREVLGSSLAFCFFGSIFSLCPDPTTNRIFRRVVSRYLKREQGQQRELTLSGEEFVRRYLTHIVAKGFMRIRHYGFLANCCRKRRLTQIRRSLDALQEVLGSSLAFCFFGSIFSLCPDPTTNRIFRRVVSRYLKREQGQQRELTLSGEEFVRRYLTHIVAKGFMRIRHYGFLANCCRKRRLTQIRRSLDALPPPDNESKNRQPAQHHPAHGATPGI